MTVKCPTEFDYIQNLSTWKMVCGYCGKPIKYGEHYRMVIDEFKDVSKHFQPLVRNPYLCHLDCHLKSQGAE